MEKIKEFIVIAYEKQIICDNFGTNACQYVEHEYRFYSKEKALACLDKLCNDYSKNFFFAELKEEYLNE